MKKIFLLSLIVAGFLGDVPAIAAPARRATRATSGATTAAAGKATTAARAAVGTRAAPRAATTTTAAKPTVSARAATTTAAKPTVSARAATTQKVVATGTKVASAAKNIVVSEECQAKYEGCMDAFCMLDNDTGGRCLCSDKNAEYDAILAEIEKLDQQSYQMATFGVEKLEMGADADAAIQMANAAAEAVVEDSSAKDGEKKVRKALDLSLWNSTFNFEDDVDGAFEGNMSSALEGKEGDMLHRAAASICAEQMPECSSEMSLMQMMYSQRVKSDCAAYENSLKQQKLSSQQKLYAAEKALREAALEQHRSANKYDLGQCTVEFKKCMQTTAGCGNDFAGCASMVALDTTSTRKSGKNADKMYSIKGAVSTIDISMSTYDALMSKKPLCESVTKSCVNVATQVWDTFLKEVAPQLRSAELIAEDRARQDCIGNISSCFQKACKDNMDPKDPDGSYDMCLSRPGTMLSLCKVPLNNCGIDATSQSTASANPIWDYVVARLAAMRVDSCTTEVKECLQSDDRCGEDYSNCIGLDTDSIIRMCPYDKLTGCQKIYGEDDIRGDEVYDELVTMVQGIMLNIDNNFITQCQNAANEAMIKVCGDTENCNDLVLDADVGARSLDYRICQYTTDGSGLQHNAAKCYPSVDGVSEGELRDGVALAGVLSGMIFWEDVDYDENGVLGTVEDYLAKTGITATDAERQLIKSEIGNLQDSINRAISAIEADPTVQFCMTGREVQGMRTNAGDSKNIGKRAKKTVDEDGNEVVENADAARFPELTKQMRQIIAMAALREAKDNYYKKYDDSMETLHNDFALIGKRVSELENVDAQNILRENGRVACLRLANKYDSPQFSFASAKDGTSAGLQTDGTDIDDGIMIYPFTDGTSPLVGQEENQQALANKVLTANSKSSSVAQINTVDVTYDWDRGVCHKCVSTQTCAKTRGIGRYYRCRRWNNAQKSCQDLSYLIQGSQQN